MAAIMEFLRLRRTRLREFTFLRVVSGLFSAIAILATIGFIVYIGVNESIAIAIAMLSLFVSTYFSSRSVKLASNSLEIARLNVRPFVYIQNEKSILSLLDTEIRFELCLRNDGVLPGEISSLEITYFEVGEKITLDNFSQRIPISYEPMELLVPLFPSSETVAASIIPNDSKYYKTIDRLIDKGKLIIRFKVLYQLNAQSYTTIQTVQLERESKAITRFLHASPQHWT